MTKDEFKSLIASFNKKHRFALILFNIEPLKVNEYNAIDITYISDVAYIFEDLTRFLNHIPYCTVSEFVKDGKAFITLK